MNQISKQKYIHLLLLVHFFPFFSFKNNKPTTSKKKKKGFNSTYPAVREATVKAMVEIVPKLDGVLIEDSVIPCLWKLQTDPQAGSSFFTFLQKKNKKFLKIIFLKQESEQM